MPTQEQLAANRQNAQHSTGPRTHAGKAASRYNALQHGILAQALIPSCLEPYESRAEFDALHQDLRADLQPASTLEDLLVERIAAPPGVNGASPASSAPNPAPSPAARPTPTSTPPPTAASTAPSASPRDGLAALLDRGTPGPLSASPMPADNILPNEPNSPAAPFPPPSPTRCGRGAGVRATPGARILFVAAVVLSPQTQISAKRTQFPHRLTLSHATGERGRGEGLTGPIDQHPQSRYNALQYVPQSRKETSTMKITGVRTVLYEIPLTRPIGDANGPAGQTHMASLAVFIDTDEGVSGVSVGGGGSAGQIRSMVQNLLVGRDPRGVRGLWKRMVDAVFKGGNRGAVGDALAAIDVALWDLKAKLNDEPLWKTLGASTRAVKAYASGLDMPLNDDELRTYYERMARMGISAGKLKVGLDQEADLRRVRDHERGPGHLGQAARADDRLQRVLVAQAGHPLHPAHRAGLRPDLGRGAGAALGLSRPAQGLPGRARGRRHRREPGRHQRLYPADRQ